MPELPEIFMRPLNGLTILSVDDNEVNQMLMRRTLEQLGAGIVEAANGRQAIDLCSTQLFDVILMDYQMPRMTGIETVEIIRKDCIVNRNTPIIGLTANISQGKNSEFHRVVDEVFVKPLDSDEVVATITACLFKKRAMSHE